jgi:predicted PurR-regulated permease PerM
MATNDPLSGPETRSTALILLAVIATIVLLEWAQAVFIPLVLALLVSYALGPVVDRLQKLAIPRALSAAVLLIAVVGGTGFAAWSVRDEAGSVIDTLPEAAQKLQEAARKEFEGPGKALERMQRAADELERATVEAATDKPPPGVTRVQIERPKLNIRQYLVTSLAGGATMIGAALIVLFLAYFLLASGDAFRRKWVALSGPTLARRRITIQVMDEIRDQIQRYLGVQVLTSAIVGVASGLAFWAIGLENPAAWGVAAGVLNLIPYLGAIVTIAGTALVAFFQFGTVSMALAVAAISFVINSLEGYWLTPWLSGRASKMNNVVVFGGLLFWGWLWGGWGLVLGLPIMMVFKAVCDHVEDLKPIGEFMGE